MPFAGLSLKAPVMAAKQGMQDLVFSPVSDDGTAPIRTVAAGTAGGAMPTPSTVASPPVFAALPALAGVGKG